MISDKLISSSFVPYFRQTFGVYFGHFKIKMPNKTDKPNRLRDVTSPDSLVFVFSNLTSE